MSDMRDRDNSDADGEPRFAPLCIWCSAPWDDSNVQIYAWASGGCPTCGPEAEAEVEIICHKCYKLMYKKEYN